MFCRAALPASHSIRLYPDVIGTTTFPDAKVFLRYYNRLYSRSFLLIVLQGSTVSTTELPTTTTPEPTTTEEPTTTTTTTTTTPTPTITTSTAFPFVCPSDGTFAMPNQCVSSYYYCIDGFPYTLVQMWPMRSIVIHVKLKTLLRTDLPRRFYFRSVDADVYFSRPCFLSR